MLEKISTKYWYHEAIEKRFGKKAILDKLNTKFIEFDNAVYVDNEGVAKFALEYYDELKGILKVIRDECCGWCIPINNEYEIFIIREWQRMAKIKCRNNQIRIFEASLDDKDKLNITVYSADFDFNRLKDILYNELL